jgi:hypothetical protein
VESCRGNYFANIKSQNQSLDQNRTPTFGGRPHQFLALLNRITNLKILGGHTVIDVDSYRKNGYLVVKGVFSQEEVAAFREAAIQTQDHPGDLLSNTRLSQVVCDDRVIDIVREVLGGRPVYFGDSSCLLGSGDPGYHKDNSDRSDPNAPDWRSDYTIIRIGIYLQDHFNHSGGLNVRSGSHNIPSVSGGRNRYLRTHPGDLVLWNLRTTHSGNGSLLKFGRSISISPGITAILPKVFFLPFAEKRIALFITYGLDDRHLDRYIRFLKTRTYMIQTWANSKPLWERFNLPTENRIELRKIELDQVDELLAQSTDGYRALPYDV